VGLGEDVRVEEPHEICESVVVSVVRRGREQQQVVGLGGKLLGELVTLGLLRLVAAARCALRVRAALVGFVNDDEVPPLLPDALADVVASRSRGTR
jgi:hypothetical protein